VPTLIQRQLSARALHVVEPNLTRATSELVANHLTGSPESEHVAGDSGAVVIEPVVADSSPDAVEENFETTLAAVAASRQANSILCTGLADENREQENGRQKNTATAAGRLTVPGTTWRHIGHRQLLVDRIKCQTR
jgi:hypothetical protein